MSLLIIIVPDFANVCGWRRAASGGSNSSGSMAGKHLFTIAGLYQNRVYGLQRWD
ncbi:MAG: hypothetical protein H6672_01445 [Anaerolineaceae bacterium]|nr:hypothetical protein [Anaerolineaceae bacterium]